MNKLFTVFFASTVALSLHSNAFAFGDKQGKNSLETHTSRPKENGQASPKKDKKPSPEMQALKQRTQDSVNKTLQKK